MTQTCRYVASTQPRVLPSRHEDACDGAGPRWHPPLTWVDCDGCLPCPEDHCVVCGRNHADVTCPDCIGAVRADLDLIRAMCDDLPPEAVERGVQSEAMTLAGPAANAEAWGNRAMSAMRGRVDAAYLEDCRDELHPLWVLGTWAELWRDTLDQPSDLRITIPRAWSYLSDHLHQLAGMLEPDFAQFASEVRACRGHLEDVLHDGVRDERTQVPCHEPECSRMLVRVYGERVADDHWRCPRRDHDRKLSAEEFARAKHRHLSSAWAEAYVRISEALAAIPRPERTIRTWVRGGSVRSRQDEKTGALLVWWPDVRRMHITTPTRVRSALREDAV